jgi:DNA-directed RNA polymerase beta subunit
MTGLKAGSKIKKGQILAYEPNFFDPIKGTTDVTYKAGYLARTALLCLDQTFEDSLVITDKLVENTTASVTMMRPVHLGHKANLEKILSIGTKVEANTPLAIFENIADDEDMADMLSRIGSEFDEAIAEMARTTALAKDKGEIVDIKIFYSYPKEELSTSLKKYINKVEKETEERFNIAKEFADNEFIFIHKPEYVNPGSRVSGIEIDGVILQFYIKISDRANPGDKYSAGGALKGIVSTVIDKGKEPIDEEGNQVDYIVSPLSLVSRMTLDVFGNLWTNSVLIDLKKRMLEIADE